MAVEFSRRPLLSLQLSLWLSIFNLNSSCNWLEGQEGGTLLVGCAVPHGSQCAGSPLPLKKHFAAMQRFAPALHTLYSFIFTAPSRMEQYTPGRIFSKAFWELTHAVTMCSSTVLQWNFCGLDNIAVWKRPSLSVATPRPYELLALSLSRQVCRRDRENYINKNNEKIHGEINPSCGRRVKVRMYSPSDIMQHRQSDNIDHNSRSSSSKQKEPTDESST